MESQWKQLKISVSSELVDAFKTACAANNATIVGVLSQFMMEYCGIVRKKVVVPPPDYSTRRKRLRVVKRILRDLEQIKAAEESLINNAPENLKEAHVYMIADEYISTLDDVIDQLRGMVP